MSTNKNLWADSDRLDDETAISPGPIAVNVLKSDTLQRSTGVLEAPAFWLTLDEKQSIEKDITAKKPIWVGESTPAYEKFLKHIFPGKSVTFPYLADYADAVKIVGELSKLFGKTVKFPSKEQAIESLKGNKHVTGYRDVISGKIENAGDYGYTWIDGVMQDGRAPYVWRFHDGDSDEYWINPRDGHSVIPVFG